MKTNIVNRTRRIESVYLAKEIAEKYIFQNVKLKFKISVFFFLLVIIIN